MHTHTKPTHKHLCVSLYMAFGLQSIRSNLSPMNMLSYSYETKTKSLALNPERPKV